jgi:quercetin dioxygenase-like cupin family protein
MNHLLRLIASLVVPAFMLAGVAANPALAQDRAKDAKAAPAAKAEKGKPTIKVLHENAKVKVYEVTYKPGDANTTIASTTTRVIRVLSGATTQWTFADGKKETKVRKTGDVFIAEPGPAYTNTNTGKTVYKIYVVQLK